MTVRPVGRAPDAEHDDRPAVLGRSTPIEELPEFLSPEEFRAYVGLGRSTVYELLRRDELPHVRFGRVIRIPKTVLSRFAASVK